MFAKNKTVKKEEKEEDAEQQKLKESWKNSNRALIMPNGPGLLLLLLLSRFLLCLFFLIGLTDLNCEKKWVLFYLCLFFILVLLFSLFIFALTLQRRVCLCVCVWSAAFLFCGFCPTFLIIKNQHLPQLPMLSLPLSLCFFLSLLWLPLLLLCAAAALASCPKLTITVITNCICIVLVWLSELFLLLLFFSL